MRFVLPWLNHRPRNRSIELDVLRGLAILLVFGNHMPYQPTGQGVVPFLAGWWVRIGWTGVDLFFVLSGFLVGGLLFWEIRKEHDLHARRFLIRRHSRSGPRVSSSSATLQLDV